MRDERPPARHRVLLARMLADAHSAARERDGMAGALAARLGIARQHDWPVAPVVLADAGIDTGARYWLRATPITLEVGHEDVRVAGPVRDLERARAEEILAVLNRHFADDDLTFVASAPDDWFVGTPAAPDLATEDLDSAAGDRVRPHLPRGADAARWLRWLHEIEMLLHAHAVTAEREATGCAPLNAVWLQQGGTLPPRGTAADVHAWTGTRDATALARHAGARLVTGAPDALLQSLGTARGVVALPEDIADDVAQAWLEATDRALAARQLAGAEIIASGDGGPPLAWRLAPRPWWRRLRPTQTASLAAIVARATETAR